MDALARDAASTSTSSTIGSRYRCHAKNVAVSRGRDSQQARDGSKPRRGRAEQISPSIAAPPAADPPVMNRDRPARTGSFCAIVQNPEYRPSSKLQDVRGTSQRQPDQAPVATAVVVRVLAAATASLPTRTTPKRNTKNADEHQRERRRRKVPAREGVGHSLPAHPHGTRPP